MDVRAGKANMMCQKAEAMELWLVTPYFGGCSQVNSTLMILSSTWWQKIMFLCNFCFRWSPSIRTEIKASRVQTTKDIAVTTILL